MAGNKWSLLSEVCLLTFASSVWLDGVFRNVMGWLQIHDRNHVFQWVSGGAHAFLLLISFIDCLLFRWFRISAVSQKAFNLPLHVRQHSLNQWMIVILHRLPPLRMSVCRKQATMFLLSRFQSIKIPLVIQPFLQAGVSQVHIPITRHVIIGRRRAVLILALSQYGILLKRPKVSLKMTCLRIKSTAECFV